MATFFNCTENGPKISKTDITSIVNSFENGSLYSELKEAQSDQFEAINNKLDHLLWWILNDFVPCAQKVRFKTKQVEEWKTKMFTLMDALETITPLHYKKRNKNVTITCPECDIVLNAKDNIGHNFQHDHFEEKFFNIKLRGKDWSRMPETVLNNGIDKSETRDIQNYSISSNGNSNDTTFMFSFNFNIDYDADIVKTFYPSELTAICEGSEQADRYMLQVIPYVGVDCLICCCNVANGSSDRETLLQHWSEPTHQRYMEDLSNRSNVSNYHKFWMSQEKSYQSHQIFFCPQSATEMFCKLCNAGIELQSITQHLTTEKHKVLFYKLVNKYPLWLSSCELQVSIYTKPKLDNKKVHNVCKSVEDPKKSGLENRFYPHLQYFQDVGEDLKRCIMCKTDFSLSEMKKHIISQKHMNKVADALKWTSFYCTICDCSAVNEDTWLSHLSDDKHNSRLEKMPPGKTYTEYECRSCQDVIFGNEKTIEKHRIYADKMYYKRKPKVIKLPDSVKNFFKSKEAIELAAENFVKDANDVLKNVDPIAKCCLAIQQTLSVTFPRCIAYPFGSRISGLGNRDSDLDLFVDIGGMYMGRGIHIPQSNILKEVLRLFRGLKREFTHVNAIPNARTPIVQVFHTKSLLDCDLSFRNGLSVENTKFLKFCVKVQPLTQTLILIIKKWFQLCSLSEYITTYAIAMMVIFFLQQCGYLPAVTKINKFCKEISIDGWSVVDFDQIPETTCSNLPQYSEPISNILIEFFDYYAHFPYESDVVCPLMGIPVKKLIFVNNKDVPLEMYAYMEKLSTSKQPEPFRAMAPLCVQDPFDLSHNLTKACGKHTVTKLQTLCELSMEHLEKHE